MHESTLRTLTHRTHLTHLIKSPRAHVNKWARAFSHLDIHPEGQRRRQINGVVQPHLLALVAEGRALEEQAVIPTNIAADVRHLRVSVATTVDDVSEGDLLFVVIRNRLGDRELAGVAHTFVAG